MLIAIDIFMMLLLLINLSLIIFDWLFLTAVVKRMLLHYFPSFYYFYDVNIHQNFFTIDLAFVSVFLIELFIRWGIAIRNHTYHRWFFYPFVHWYDTIGCIPVASFRFFRILRVISIMYRLQRLSIIDLQKTYLYGVVSRYYEIVVEEISDRVVLNILSSVQEELRRDNPVTDKIIQEVIVPRREVITEWLVHRIRKVVAGTYQLHKTEIQEYISQLVGEAIKGNKEVKAINQLPIVGGLISKTLEKTVADITLKTVNSAMEDLSGDRQHALFHNITENVVEELISKEEQEDLSKATREVLLESLALIKVQVEIQQWKLRENAKGEVAIHEDTTKTDTLNPDDDISIR